MKRHRIWPRPSPNLGGVPESPVCANCMVIGRFDHEPESGLALVGWDAASQRTLCIDCLWDVIAEERGPVHEW